MFDFIRNMFAGKRDSLDARLDSNSRGEVAPGTEIYYDPKLIQRFLGQHAELVEEIHRVKRFLDANNYPATIESLRAFKAQLQQHLLEENLRFYTYLTHCLVDDSEGRELMNDMRIEMGEIGRLLTRFIKHYLEFGINDLNADKFGSELTSIMHALGDRIGREEKSLYTLYLPPSTIARR